VDRALTPGEPARLDERNDETVRAGWSEGELRANVIRLAFGGDAARYQEFCRVLETALPPDTAAVLRGSAITGERHADHAPFDADGPGTSDLDLTLVGGSVLDLYQPDGFFIPGVHSKPVSEKDPDIAPRLLPLRRRLMDMVGRPVNIQGTRDWVMYFREYLMGQPYLTLVGKVESD
jgi:hypothetical protein